MKILNVEDPAMKLLESTIRGAFVDGFGNTHSFEPEVLGENTDRVNLYRADYRKNKPAHRLSAAFDGFQYFADSFEACLAAAERTVPKIVNDGGFGPIPEYLQIQKEAFEKLQELFESLTPAHFAMQAHFYTLVVESAMNKVTLPTSINSFFRPLYDLRDEYFNSPQESTLQTYLLKSRELIESDYYRNYVAPEATSQAEELQTEITKYEIELEVFSLMEEVV